MDSTPIILVAIKPLHYQGQQIYQEDWPLLLGELTAYLQEVGVADTDSNDTLLLFTFNHPNSALTTLCHFNQKTHRSRPWQGGEHVLPLQIIVHLRQPESTDPPAYRNPNAGLWEFLSPGVIHISKALRYAWEILMTKTTLPPITIKSEDNGLFSLQLAPGDLIPTEPLLSGRDLAIQGSEPPCFYCGLRCHPHSQCPSKQLTMEHEALSAVGYLPFQQLNLAYHKVFTNPTALSKPLASGITPSQIRKDAELMVFVAFLDINRVYQLRFLWHLAFSRYSKWQAVWKSEQIIPDNKNLQLGLDCLRVGKHPQAEEFLRREHQAKSTRRFPAAIGLAFIALETRGLSEMRSFLELAKSMATQAKEHVYVDLLLAHCHDLIGETWKATNIIKNLLTTQADLTEAFYRKLQLEGNESAEVCQLLRFLILDQRTLYMAALLDPALLFIQSKVEDLLATQYEAKARGAEDLLAQATLGTADLGLWLDSQDPQLMTHQATLRTLQQNFQRHSYFDVLDVEYQAKTLIANTRELQEAKLNELYDQLKQAKSTWKSADDFWTVYRYKLFFKDFGNILPTLARDLYEINTLAKKNEGANYQAAAKLLLQTNNALAALGHRQAQMNLVNLACDSGISFIKKLAIAEIAGAIIANTLIFGLSQLPAAQTISTLANDPLLQKKILMLTAFMLAPLLALTLTVKEQLQT